MSDMVSSDELARRLRSQMGAEKVSRLRLADETGISRTSLGSKLDGHVPFTYGELMLVIEALGLSWLEVLTA